MECVIDGGYDSYPSFFKEKWVKARKDHICCECGETIKKGELYENVVGVWKGDFHNFKTCAPCARIREDFFCSWTYGMLWEDLYQFFFEQACPDEEDEVFAILPKKLQNTEQKGD